MITIFNIGHIIKYNGMYLPCMLGGNLLKTINKKYYERFHITRAIKLISRR